MLFVTANCSKKIVCNRGEAGEANYRRFINAVGGIPQWKDLIPCSTKNSLCCAATAGCANIVPIFEKLTPRD